MQRLLIFFDFLISGMVDMKNPDTLFVYFEAWNDHMLGDVPTSVYFGVHVCINLIFLI